jgi:hypothetical protein
MKKIAALARQQARIRCRHAPGSHIQHTPLTVLGSVVPACLPARLLIRVKRLCCCGAACLLQATRGRPNPPVWQQVLEHCKIRGVVETEEEAAAGLEPSGP